MIFDCVHTMHIIKVFQQKVQKKMPKGCPREHASCPVLLMSPPPAGPHLAAQKKKRQINFFNSKKEARPAKAKALFPIQTQQFCPEINYCI